MARGGPRQGTPGATYQNRTDLQRPSIPQRPAPGQTYGQGVQQQQAIQTAPMGPPPVAGGGGTATPPPPAPRTAPEPTPLFAPTQRPNEPLTAGVDTGPGPDSSVLNLNAGQTADTLASMLETMPQSTEVAALVAYIREGKT